MTVQRPKTANISSWLEDLQAQILGWMREYAEKRDAQIWDKAIY